MPSKKGGSNHVGNQEDKENKCQGTATSDIKDPFDWMLSHVEKKKRNLEKRKSRLATLNEQLTEGKSLDKDQKDAVKKLPEVSMQIEILSELFVSFQQIHEEYQKELKKRQKAEEKHQKDTEKASQQDLLRYCLRVERLLNLIDNTAKEAFRTGSNGAVVLSEAELTQIDNFYDLVTPIRAGNDKYGSGMVQAADHFLYLFEKSSKEVVNTTYAGLHDLLVKIDTCGYFDKEIEEEEEIELEENEEIEEERSKTPDPVITEYMRVESPREATPPDLLPAVVTYSEIPITNPLTVETVQPSHSLPLNSNSVPSPDFVGLQATAFSPLDELTFMRESPIEANVVDTQIFVSNYQNVTVSEELPPTREVSETHLSSFATTATPGHSTTSKQMEQGSTDTTTGIGGIDSSQFVPETGQQVIDDKEKSRTSKDYRNKGFNQQRGGNSYNNRWRNGSRGGGYNNYNNRGFNNSGGSGGMKQGGGSGQQRGKGRPYSYNSRPSNMGYKRPPQ